jgi:hypothetical protein
MDFDTLDRMKVFGDSGGARISVTTSLRTHLKCSLELGVDEGHHHGSLHSLGNLHGGIRVSVSEIKNIPVDCVTCQEKVGPSGVYLVTGLEQHFRNWG